MAFASDFVTKYRETLGQLLICREQLRAMGKQLNAMPTLLDDVSAFSGINADIAASDIVGARAVLDALDVAATSSDGALYKVAGSFALPR